MLALSALFCREAATHRNLSWLLVPFGAWSLYLEPGPLGWLPAIAAFVAWLGVRLNRPGAERAHTFSALLLFLAVAGSSLVHARAHGIVPLKFERPLPEVARLASLARDMIPEGEPLVTGLGFRLHAALFYGQRSIHRYPYWLLHDFRPGAVSYGLFARPPASVGFPWIQPETVAGGEGWHLVRLTMDPAATHVLGILRRDHRGDGRREAAALDLLQVGYEMFARGFVITSIVQRADRVLPAAAVGWHRQRAGDALANDVAWTDHAITLEDGDALVMEPPQGVRVCAIPSVSEHEEG